MAAPWKVLATFGLTQISALKTILSCAHEEFVSLTGKGRIKSSSCMEKERVQLPTK